MYILAISTFLRGSRILELNNRVYKLLNNDLSRLFANKRLFCNIIYCLFQSRLHQNQIQKCSYILFSNKIPQSIIILDQPLYIIWIKLNYEGRYERCWTPWCTYLIVCRPLLSWASCSNIGYYRVVLHL